MLGGDKSPPVKDRELWEVWESLLETKDLGPPRGREWSPESAPPNQELRRSSLSSARQGLAPRRQEQQLGLQSRGHEAGRRNPASRIKKEAGKAAHSSPGQNR